VVLIFAVRDEDVLSDSVGSLITSCMEVSGSHPKVVSFERSANREHNGIRKNWETDLLDKLFTAFLDKVSMGGSGRGF
jgi:hypothetical protein